MCDGSKVHMDSKGAFYKRECMNTDCRVSCFIWRKPGDTCPGCGWS